MKKHILPIFIALCMVMVSFPIMTFADYATTIYVNSYTDLYNAIRPSTAPTGEGPANTTLIVIQSGFDVTGLLQPNRVRYLTIVADKNVTLTRGAGNTNNLFDFSNASVVTIGAAGYTGVITFNGNNIANTNSVFYVNSGAKFSFDSCVFTNLSGAGYAIKAQGTSDGSTRAAVVLNSGVVMSSNANTQQQVLANKTTDVTINGATISNNAGPALWVQAGSTATFNSGLIKGNNGDVIFVQGNTTTGQGVSTFTMNDGTIDGSGTYTDTNQLIKIDAYSTATFNGGTIKNSKFTAIALNGINPSAVFNAGSSGSGITMQNCGWDGTNDPTANNGGGCFRFNGTASNANITINAGTFKNSRTTTSGGFAGITNSTATFNLFGGTISGCDKAILYQAGTLNMKGSVSFAQTDSIVFGTSSPIPTVNVVGDLTTVGAVATFADVTNGQQVLSGSSMAANAGKFAAVTTNATSCGVNSSGAVDTSVQAPTFGGSTPSATVITLGFNGTAAIVNSNVAIPSAELIVASYNASGNLVDVETFPVAVEANIELQKAVTDFNSGSQVKVMLWDSLETIKPLTAVFVQ